MQAPTKIYHISGETADMTYSIDARDAVERHPNEWSFQPFSAAQINAHRDAVVNQEAGAIPGLGKSKLDLRNAKLAGAATFNGETIE